MAKTTVTTDDIDGSANAETVEFSLNGSSYTIDLAKKNRSAFEKVLKPYIDKANKTSRTPRTRRASAPSRKRDLGAVRLWAAEQGMDVSERGRVAGDVIAAYDAAH